MHPLIGIYGDFLSGKIVSSRLKFRYDKFSYISVSIFRCYELKQKFCNYELFALFQSPDNDWIILKLKV